MKANFARCLEIVLGYEGGFSNNPDDPGGATMRGVTQGTYDSHRIGQGLSPQPVELISESELQAIYRTGYWDRVCGDALPAGADLAIFDFAVNSGPTRAVKMVQEIVGADPDGKFGPETLACVKRIDPIGLVSELCLERLEFLQGLSHWPTFKNGWQKRVRGIEASALAMIDAPAAPIPSPKPTGPLNTTGAPGGPTASLFGLIVSAFAWLLKALSRRKSA
jgi:lysozyme family protein